MIPNKNQPKSGAKAIIECMKRESVSHVFCVPGESYLPVLDAIHDEESIALISARHEGGASFMAEGYAKASGKPGVVMATRGVGGSNLTIGVHTAYQDSTPMVVFLGQVHRDFRGREGFQEIDLDQYFSHIAKWTVEIQDAKRVPELVQRAFRIAQTGRPGPVVVSLPEDMLIEKAFMSFANPVQKPAPRPSVKEIEAIESLLHEAERPLIIAGGGVQRSGAELSLWGFAKTYEIPVMAAFRRHDVFPNDDEHYVGHLGLGTHTNLLETVEKADTILAFGTRLSEVTTQDYSIINKDHKLIHVDIDFEVIGNVFAPDVGVVADLKESLQALSKINVTTRWSEWRKERRRAYEDATSIDKESFNQNVIATMQKLLTQDAVLTNDAGNFAGWLHSFYQFRKRNTYVGPTSGAMGYGMPAALGAKLARPERTVVSLSGDGGFMMTMQELETAVRCNIPIISVVFNNQMYGTIRMHQEIHYPYKTIGTNLGSVQFAEIAKGMGARGFFVRTIEEFEEALTEAMNGGVAAVIEIESDPEQISVSSTIQQVRDKHR
ncbi:thiamine pyrophosphate-dependent enzyme [Pontibacillus marinus]|uniref:Acetolactate synthase n=1 Tax=Pontibacillus marinus BH030004 = DSM 16465 TaxID=1385511 RepID=A0A0A5I4Q2_9BACI|nr:thiamine pyrophosphate-dependent enzyme [Pontibacillus marinus]KGX90807.1 acetolactate synthase [Pontibacillus marinus BH030004 = DSM 16465]